MKRQHFDAKAALDDLLRRARRGPLQIEAVVDTSVGGPYLNLWAWKALPPEKMEHLLAKVAQTGDPGFLYDELEELACSTFEWPLSELYPRWPDDVDEGDARLLEALVSAGRALKRSRVVSFDLHHVDVFPLTRVKLA